MKACTICGGDLGREVEVHYNCWLDFNIALDSLAHNLAIGAALCRSFDAGVYAAASWLSGQLDGQNAWEPGCRRPAPSAR